MDNILILDTSHASLNKGDDIIMECVHKELGFILKGNFEINLPTHIPPFHSYQVWRNSNRVKTYRNAKYKFVGGTNLLVADLLTHFPQWNINIFNYSALKDCILTGVGVGADENINRYTSHIYKKMLNKDYYHSCRDERSKLFVEHLGLKALNTGCVTMWMLTPDFCAQIPTKKSDNVVFTLTALPKIDVKDQVLIDTLNKNYKNVYFWPQGINDYSYLHRFDNIDNIKIIESTKDAYHSLLMTNNIEYVGTRLHGGVYAMRHKKRAVIIAIDERAREINKCNNLNCIEKDDITILENMISSEFSTDIVMPYDAIDKWKEQFVL